MYIVFALNCVVIKHRFPLNDKDRLQRWIHAVSRKDFNPNKGSKICSDHFKESDFMDQSGFRYKRLKLDAVPSVFPQFPPHKQKKDTVRTTKTSAGEYCTH